MSDTPTPAQADEKALTEIEMAEKVAAALIIMARSNIPADIQELLVGGNPDRSIPPGILKRVLAEADGRQVAHGRAATRPGDQDG